ncbi:MAG: ribose ABC transporter permease, partial [Lachnospiraceae bacterium]|nr:ribose ABC transporter permease [Lachnospiraceae bacterium]
MNNNKKLSAVLSEYAAFIALILLALGLCAISPEFRQMSNLLNLLRQAAFNGLIAIGMTCVILSDGIDLSVGSTFALAAIICAEMLVSGVPAPLAIAAALVAGTVLGLISGILVA